MEYFTKSHVTSDLKMADRTELLIRRLFWALTKHMVNEGRKEGKMVNDDAQFLPIYILYINKYI